MARERGGGSVLSSSSTLSVPASSPRGGRAKFVGDATTGANDGTSGAAATISLQSALWAAQPIDRSGVAAGPCRPDVGRAALADEVELGGGFARCNAIPLSFTP